MFSAVYLAEVMVPLGATKYAECKVPSQVLELRPELANYTFFGSNYNVMHHAAGNGVCV
jgi:hypothetical protein